MWNIATNIKPSFPPSFGYQFSETPAFVCPKHPKPNITQNPVPLSFSSIHPSKLPGPVV